MSVKQLPPATAISPAREPDLHRLGRIALRRRWAFFGAVAAALLTGLLITISQTPSFESSATIRLEQEERGTNLLAAFAPPGLAAAAGLGGGGSIQTDIGVLQSRVLAQAVVDSLDLNVVLRESELARDSIIEVLNAPRTNLTGGVYRLQAIDGGRYRVLTENEAAPPFPEQVEIGRPFFLGEAQLRIRPAAADAPERDIVIAVMPFRAAVDELRDDLVVMRPDPSAALIQLRFEHPDPVIAAAVPNVLADRFVQYKTRENRQQSLSTVDFLQEQVENYGDALHSAEAQLEQFRERAQVYSPEEQARSSVQQVAALQAEMDAVAAEHNALLQLLGRIERAPASPDGRSPYRQLASFPAFFANGAVQDILRTLTELETERSSLLVRRTSENVDVQALDARIEQLEQQLHRLGQGYAQNLETTLGSLAGTLTGYRGQLETIPAREIELLRLMREQKLLEQVYTLLQTRLKEEQIEATRVAGNVRVVDAALLPLSPSSPRPLMNLAVAGLLGVLLGIALMGAMELVNPRIHTGGDLLLAGVAAPILGIIPRTGNGAALRDALPSPIRRRFLPPPAESELITRTEPAGIGAEAYRALRTGLLRTANGDHPQTVTVTSAMPGEGKSVTAGNLAVSLASKGRSTLLIDADLRGGKLHRLLRIDPAPGLSDLLHGRTQLDETLRQISLPTPGSTLHVLTVGAAPLEAAELIDSETMSDLLESLRKRYQHIVIDTPPLNLVSDAIVLAGAADTTLLVARTGVTEKRALQHAMNLLLQLQVPLGGVVLTDVPGAGWYQGYEPIAARTTA